MRDSHRILAVGVALIVGISCCLKQRLSTRGPAAVQIPIDASSEEHHLSYDWGLREIHAPAVWPRYQGSKKVLVAIIDTGCDIQHPELAGNIWVNPGESGVDANGQRKEDNGIDDDANGFVDDLHGWSFVSNSNDVSDNHGHGTHIAGIIGAKKLGGMSLGGVAPHVSLMILKYYDTAHGGIDHLRFTIEAIRYAVQMGADIINYSGGGALSSPEEENALRWAAQSGVLVVAAAGNDGLNSDEYHYYPADYPLPNILSVAALDQSEHLLPVSNYGVQTVHLAAPGKNIYSTLPHGGHGFMTGTSQATAFVTGVAALLIANDPRFRRHPDRVIHHLLRNSSRRSYLLGKIRSHGLLDAQLALESSTRAR